MTELASRIYEHAPDEDDLRMRVVLADLQAIVDDFLSRTGRSINELTVTEQQALVDAIDPHLAFELRVTEGLHVGLPLVASGAGGFLLTDSQGALLGAQQTEPGDVVTGMVSAVKAYPVPSRQIILSSTGPDGIISPHDQSLSAVVLLDNARFHTDPSSDGTFQIVHELTGMTAVIPVIYGMDTRVSDIDV